MYSWWQVRLRQKGLQVLDKYVLLETQSVGEALSLWTLRGGACEHDSQWLRQPATMTVHTTIVIPSVTCRWHREDVLEKMAATANSATSGPQRSTRAGSEPPPPKHVVTVTTHSDPPVRPPAGSNRNQATRTLPASGASGNSRPTNSAATPTSRGGVSGNSGPGTKPTRAKHLATATSHPELSAQASASSSRTQSTAAATRTLPTGVAPGSSRPSSNVPQTNQAGASGNSTRGGDAARKHITVVTTQPETGTRPSTGSSRNQSTSAASRTLPASGASGSTRATTNATQTNPRSGQAAARPAGTEPTREGGSGSASGQTTNTAAAGNVRHANNEGISNRVSVSVISRPSVTAAGDGVSGNSRPANSAVTVTDAGVSGNSRSANNATRSNRENVPGSNRPGVDRAAATTLQHEAATPHVVGRVEHDNTRGATYPRPVSTVSDIMINISDVRQLVDPSRRGQLDALSSQGHENILMRPETLQALQAQPPMAIGHPSDHPNNEALPDILNSHLLPPYAVRPNQHRSARQGANARPQAARTRTRSSRPRRHRQPTQTTQLDDEDKTCCGCLGCLHCITVVTQFRWVLLALAMLGVICIVTGIILGAVHMSINTNFLTLSLMFIGEYNTIILLIMLVKNIKVQYIHLRCQIFPFCYFARLHHEIRIYKPHILLKITICDGYISR